ncbi:MAG: IS3 family transposase [Candidatus Krumholzibacteriia bacterium]
MARKTRYTSEQIALALQQHQAGIPLHEIIRKYGISQQTFYRWRHKYGGLAPSEVRRLKQLEDENRRLKQLVADLTLDKQILQDVLKKKRLRPARRRQEVARVQDRYRVSERRACDLLRFARSSHRYRSVRQDPVALRQRLKELAITRPRFGYRRLWVLLRREGWAVNHKKVYRLYREEGLYVRQKRRKKRTSQLRVLPQPPSSINELWTIDFMQDATAQGRTLRVFGAIDVFSRECVALHVSPSIPAPTVTALLDQAIARRGKPAAIQLDNGTEFTSNHFDLWAYTNSVRLNFSRPGKPGDNPFIESFNGRLRDECLNVHWFSGLDDARRKIEDWRRDYNETRPHSSLGDLAPATYVAELLGLSPAAQL